MEKNLTVDELKKRYLYEVAPINRGVLNYGHWLETLLLNKIKESNEWEKELTELTPGGSEFAGDPKACGDFVRTLLHTKHEKIIELKKELNGLYNEETFTREKIETLQSEIHKIVGDGEVMELFNKLLGNATTN